MSSWIASFVCVAGIAGLLFLNRENSTRVSKALWLPGIWIALVGSRPLSLWLGLTPPENARLDGSPVDAAAFGVLLICAIGVLLWRKRRLGYLLKANWILLIFFAYCLLSIAWSYHPDVSFKRWFKSTGDVAMAMVIATENHPVVAFKRLASRIAILLFPVSVLFIKYFNNLGRFYNNDGLLMNTGVTLNKNSLGLIALLLSLVVLWNVRSLLANVDEVNRGRRLLAQCTLLFFGVALLWMANSSTCKACFLLGSLVIITLNLRSVRRRPARVHLIFLAILVSGAALFIGGQTEVATALGRDSSLSGRTEIWKAVIAAVPNPIVGAGYESFWLSPSVQVFQQQLLDWGWYPPLVRDLNEAHNGYIDIYLNLGWVGIGLIGLLLVGGYRQSIKVFRKDPRVGSLFLAYIAVAAVYQVTEAGIRMLNPCWVFLLIAIVGASSYNSRFATFSNFEPSEKTNEDVVTTVPFDEIPAVRFSGLGL